jgi:hypothetical protein
MGCYFILQVYFLYLEIVMTEVKEVKKNTWSKDLTFRQMGVSPIEGWSDNDLITFWDDFITYNLRLLALDSTQSADIIDWLNSPEFILVAKLAGLNGETIRDSALKCYTPKPKKVRRGFTKIKLLKPIEETINGFVHYAFNFGE